MEEKPECPESTKSWYDGTRLCNLSNGRICLLESDFTCEYYDEYLTEFRRDNCPLAGGVECCEDCSNCNK